MTTPLTLTRPATIHCLARLFGVSGCFRNSQSNRGLVLVSITTPIRPYRNQKLIRFNSGTSQHIVRLKKRSPEAAGPTPHPDAEADGRAPGTTSQHGINQRTGWTML